MNLLDSHIHSLTAHHLIGLLSDSVCAGAHLGGHPFLHVLKLGESLSGRETRGAEGATHEVGSSGKDIWGNFRFRVTRFIASDCTVMLEMGVDALPRGVHCFTFIVNLFSLVGYLKREMKFSLVTLLSMKSGVFSLGDLKCRSVGLILFFIKKYYIS